MGEAYPGSRLKKAIKILQSVEYILASVTKSRLPLFNNIIKALEVKVLEAIKTYLRLYSGRTRLHLQ
ncbi:hypothetical protein GIB67_005632, partial [Kingdonia uniflora]